MNNVILINPPTPDRKKIIRNTGCASESKGNYLLQPYDFLLIAGMFPSVCNVHYLDGLADNLSQEEILSDLIVKKPSLIITAIVDRLWDNDFSFLIKLRTQHPQTPILIFGDILVEKKYCEEVLQYADGVIASPLELNTEELALATRENLKADPSRYGLKNVHSGLPVGKKSSARKLYRPRHELFLKNLYRFPFATFKNYSTVNISWGCPYSCSYCLASQLPSYYREAEEVLGELRELSNLGVREIYFADLSFGIPYANTRKVLEGMINEKLYFHWSTYFHPNQYSEEFLTLMKNAGCHTLIIGVESYNLASLEKYGRTTPKEKIEDLIKCANRLKINICADFILGLPNESKEDVLKTIAYAKELNIDYASFNIAAPLPGSSIKRMAIEEKRLSEDDHHYDSMGKSKVLSSNLLSNEELVELKNYAVRSFYLRPGYLMKRLSRLRSWEHFLIQWEEMIQLFRKAS